MVERLDAEAALARVQLLEDQGRRVLGVDGYRAVPGGYISPLDMILDLATSPTSVAENVTRARAFIRTHAAPSVTFEIVQE